MDTSKIWAGVTLNIVTNNEHVPEVERYIRTIKERTRSVYNSLPFKKFPNRLLMEIVYAQVFWLNAFPSANGISKTSSPCSIVTGSGIDYNLHCKLECGSYVQTHENHSNNMEPHMIGELALRPTGNVQGGFYFYNLATGCVISRRQWTCLPMPAEVIDTAHTLAENDKAKEGIDYNEGIPAPIRGVDTDDAGVQDDDDENYENYKHSNAETLDGEIVESLENGNYDNDLHNGEDNIDEDYEENLENQDNNTAEITGVNENGNREGQITGVHGFEIPPRITGVQNDHEDGGGDHLESIIESSGIDEIVGDSIAKYADRGTG